MNTSQLIEQYHRLNNAHTLAQMHFRSAEAAAKEAAAKEAAAKMKVLEAEAASALAEFREASEALHRRLKDSGSVFVLDGGQGIAYMPRGLSDVDMTRLWIVSGQG